MKIAIFGAGANGVLFLRGMRQAGVVVDVFIDQQPQQAQIDGVPLSKPESIEDKEEWQLFCAIFPRSLVKPSNSQYGSVEEILHQLGFPNVVGFADTLEQFPTIIQGYFQRHHLWMHSNSAVMVDQQAIEQLRPLLCDPQSVQLLDRWVEWRMTQDMEHYIQPDGQCEYFPADIPGLFPRKPLHFIDCGAYSGDTVEDLYSLWEGEIELVTCFEPDSDNLQQLQQTLERLQHSHDQVYCNVFPCGVGVKTEILSFSGGQGSSSAMVMGGEGQIQVPVVSLDQTIGLSQPNYIKMDIEGAELDALQGARELIEREAPSLAICLYHKPEDLWEIPLYIHSIQPSYKMDIRTHDHLGLSSVLYCYI